MSDSAAARQDLGADQQPELRAGRGELVRGVCVCTAHRHSGQPAGRVTKGQLVTPATPAHIRQT